ncbi:amidohydrolase [Rhodopirellula maiorica SM1]|uniref:Amidohydrolase n=1 Tax=Rhodopirellula maiorica SM1 TaxID=1265738 RepID=M5RPT9_9BACT|nr:amidohydrolase [Rhodopirellula maiorica SM1]
MDRQQIVEVGQGPPPADAEDLGDVALLPSLVNAHTHLEFSDCETPIGEPGVALYQWVGQVIAARQSATIDAKAAAINKGLTESLDAGVSLIGEIATLPSEYPSHPRFSRHGQSPELVTFAETIGLSPQRGNERFELTEHHVHTQPSAGISPHAPYSTSRPLIQRCVQLACQSRRPLAMHVAESPAERELLSSGSGPFAETLKQLGVWDASLFPWGAQPFAWLIDLLAKVPRGLLVHGNDFQRNEIEAIAKHPSLSVVYCPQTHHFFRYEPHPVAEMLDRGIRVALGTDSRASNPDLNLWREIQFLLKHRPDIDPEQVLAMGTINGADAMGRIRHGRLQPGSLPLFNRVPTTAKTLQEVYQDFAEQPLRHGL